jgi:hypothetical protein
LPKTKTEYDREGEKLYGPFYRYELEQKYVDQAVNTGFLYGNTPKNNGLEPTVQAYRRDNTPNKRGKIEFYTPVKPSPAGPQVIWNIRNPGVIQHSSDTVKIPIAVTAAIPVTSLRRN